MRPKPLLAVKASVYCLCNNRLEVEEKAEHHFEYLGLGAPNDMTMLHMYASMGSYNDRPNRQIMIGPIDKVVTRDEH